METDDLSPCQFVAEFVIARKKRGPFLSYHDYLVIQKWLDRCPDFDFLLLLLADLLPALFSKHPNSSLRAIDRTVMTKIARHALRNEIK